MVQNTKFLKKIYKKWFEYKKIHCWKRFKQKNNDVATNFSSLLPVAAVKIRLKIEIGSTKRFANAFESPSRCYNSGKIRS